MRRAAITEWIAEASLGDLPTAEQVKGLREGVRCHPPVGDGQRSVNGD